jgi:hypothetical protein
VQIELPLAEHKPSFTKNMGLQWWPLMLTFTVVEAARATLVGDTVPKKDKGTKE